MRKLSPIIVALLVFALYPAYPLAADPPNDLDRFVWVGRFPGVGNPQAVFDETTDLPDFARFDVVILARFHANFDREIHHQEAARLKEAHPGIRVFAYFPAEQRLADATYAACTEPEPVTGLCSDGLPPFNEDWAVSCSFIEDPMASCGGPTCRDGRLVHENLDCVQSGIWVQTDLTVYQNWVADVVATWMQETHTVNSVEEPVYDGVMFDLAYGSARTSNRIRERFGCSTVLDDETCLDDCSDFGTPPCAAEAIFDGVADLLRHVKNDPRMAGKWVLYNGLQTNNSYRRGSCRHDEALALDAAAGALRVDGVHNEYFCHHRSDIDGNGSDADNWQARCNLLEDLEHQWALAKDGRWVLSKANFKRPNQQPQSARDDIGSYCYASYLLAEVRGLTSFKLGGGAAAPRVLDDQPQERSLELGPPLFGSLPATDTKFEILLNGLAVRHFENAWVVVNMDDQEEASFVAPESLIRSEVAPPAGQPTAIDAGDAVVVPPNDATYLTKPAVPADPGVCSEGLSHNRYEAGTGGLDWTERIRAASDSACCDARTECAQADSCYRSGAFVEPLSGNDAVCSTSDVYGNRFGPKLHACDSSVQGKTLTDTATGRDLCCASTVPQPEQTSTAVLRFEPAGHSSCTALGTCSSSLENHARRMGSGFGTDWSTVLRHGNFEKCCNPQTSCNKDACWSPGTVLPRLRQTDEVCGGVVAGGSLGWKPALYTCDASHVGDVFTDQVTSQAWCCTERTLNGHAVYVFDHESHEACVSEPAASCTAVTNRNSFWGPDLGTDWSRRDPSPTLAYHAPGCCNPSQTCNRGGTCYADGTLLPRLGSSHEICATLAANAAGALRPAIYRCDESTLGQSLTTPANASAAEQVTFCCTQTAEDPQTGTFAYAFVPGDCPELVAWE